MTTRLRPGQSDDTDMDARIERISRRVSPVDRPFWQAWEKRTCRGCDESFQPRARAQLYCEVCRPRAEEASGSRVVDGPPRFPEAGDAPVSPRPSLTAQPNPYAAGEFGPVTPKSCGCGARGEWPGRYCPTCKEERDGLVRPVFGPKRRGRAA